MAKRTRVCLDCRSVVASTACPAGPKHRVVDLATEGGRAQLVNEVWGPPSWRRERARLARAGGGGAAAGGLGDLSGCGGCDIPSIGGDLGEALGAILIIIAVALAAILVVWLLGKLITYVRRKRAEPIAMGALSPPVRRPSERRVRGVVVAAVDEGGSLLSGEHCVAWAAELSVRRWLKHHVMLRDGESFGFDLRLEDGRVMRVPAGAVRLHRGGREEGYSEVGSYLTTVDPKHAEADEPAIPYDRVAATEIRVGDHVEVFGELSTVSDPDAPPTYRGTAAMILAPSDVPLIRRVS